MNQEAALTICNDKRSALVDIADAYNKAAAEVAQQLKPRHWWFW